MAPRAATPPAQQQQQQQQRQAALTKHELSAERTRYIVTKTEMDNFLTKTFGPGLDFKVSTKSGRWIYYAERPLTKQEVSKWIAELDKRKKAVQAEASRARGTEGSRSSGGRV